MIRTHNKKEREALSEWGICPKGIMWDPVMRKTLLLAVFSFLVRSFLDMQQGRPRPGASTCGGSPRICVLVSTPGLLLQVSPDSSLREHANRALAGYSNCKHSFLGKLVRFKFLKSEARVY